MLVADEPDLAAALLLLFYPYIRRGNPSSCGRSISQSSVSVQGTADPFGSGAELESAITAIPAFHRILPVKNAGRDLKRGRFDLTTIVEALGQAIETDGAAAPR